MIPIPIHEAIGKKSLLEQASILGENTGRNARDGYSTHGADHALRVIQSNTASEAERAAIAAAFDAGYAKGCPPYRFVVLEG